MITHLDIHIGLWRLLYLRCLFAAVIQIPLGGGWAAIVAIGDGGVSVGVCDLYDKVTR